MYKITIKENMMSDSNFELYKKELATLEEASDLYKGLFPLAINLIVEYYKCLITQNPDLEEVFNQVIHALQELEVNEPVVFNASDAPFFTSDENFLEFQLAGRYFIAKVDCLCCVRGIMVENIMKFDDFL